MNRKFAGPWSWQAGRDTGKTVMPSLRMRLFQIYARLRRPMTMGVRAIVENADGHVFLVRHTYVRGWYLPGGGVERGETCIEALRRELVEEGGIHLTGVPGLVGIFSNHSSFPNDHVLLYHVPDAAWRAGRATSVGEIAETCWCAPDRLPDDTTDGTRQRIEEFRSGCPPSPYWLDNP